MRKILIIISIFIIGCSSIAKKKIKSGAIDHPAYLACLKTNIKRHVDNGYIPTEDGLDNIRISCYIKLKLAGLIK
jgi:uncharacterized protein YceK